MQRYVSAKVFGCLLVVALLVPSLQALFLSGAHASSEPYIAGHQLNFGTGNKYLSATDVRLGGPIGSLGFSRTYNSQNATTSTLGYGWTGTFTERLMVGSTIHLVQTGGRYIEFVADGTDRWVTAVGTKRILTKTVSGYQLRDPKGDLRQFDATGKLLSFTDRNGNGRTYTYSGELVASITDSFGRSLSFTYTDGKLTQLDSAAGSYTYSYANDNLVKVDKPGGATIQYIYDDPNDSHNLTGVIDESDERILTVTYDDQDRVVSSAKANGSNKITIAYLDTLHREVTDSLGVKTTYQLKVVKGVVKIDSMTGPGCSSCGDSANTQYVYDARLQVIEALDANSVKTTYAYDDAGNRTEEVRAAGTPLAETTSTTYDAATNQPATITRASVANPGNSTVTTMSYDAAGNLLSRKQSGFSGSTAIEATTTYTYDGVGRILSIDGPRTDVSDVVSFAYYPDEAAQGLNRGQLQSVTNSLGQSSHYSDYTVLGQPRTVTDASGLVTSRTYDQENRLVSSTTAGLTTSYSYDAAGRVESVTLPGGRITSYSYTPAGQVEKIIDSLGNSISYSYDTEGRRIGEEVRDSANTLTRSASFGYDSYDRLNLVTLPDGAKESSEYDLVGNLLQTVDPLSRTTSYSYDALNRLLSVTESGLQTGGYSYDGQGNVTSVTDALGRTTSYVYDDFGRRVAATAPDTGSTSYSYDPAGNLVAVTDALGNTVSYQYDGSNRPTTERFGDTEIAFSYDQRPNGIGRLSSVSDVAGTTAFSYDPVGRLTTENRVIDNITHTIGYSYDSIGDLAGMTYPSGMTLAYSRDANGRIKAISIDGTPLVSGVSRLPFGPLASATLGSVELSREYNARYDLTGISAGYLQYDYSRDLAGRVTAITGLAAPATEDGTADYGYGANNNQLTTVTGKDAKSFSYDANGNMAGNGTDTFVYDGLNRLIRIERGGTTLAEYEYDASNRRIRKNTGDATTHYLYDQGNQLIAETTGDGSPLREYIYLDGQPLALREYQHNPGTYYFLNDHLGTPQQLITADGTVVWQAAYLPFGKAQVVTEMVTNNLRFPGQYFDAETGMHYNWHRFYDPETGRYISADPIGLDGGMNLYAYVEGNPVSWTDPLGLEITGKWDSFNASVTDWEYTGLTSHLKRGPGGNNLVDRLGNFNFLVSGSLGARVKCKETDDCGNVKREWMVDGSVVVNDLPFRVPYDEPAIPIPGMGYAVWADKIWRVSQYMNRWRGMIETAGKELLNSPTLICKGSSFEK